jgi:hypothetical protein
MIQRAKARFENDDTTYFFEGEVIMTRPTLLDVAKRSLGDAEVGLIEESLVHTPELTGVDREYGRTFPGVGQVKTIKGIHYKTKIRTSLPSAGFRDANEGVTVSKSTFENRLVETFILNPRWECDKAVADRDEEGPEAFIADEANGILQAAFLQAARNFYYGRTSPGDAKGCPGLIDIYDATNRVVDATGTTDNTASSVWLIKWGPQDVRWVVGQNGELAISEVRTETLYDAASKPFTGYVQELLAYLGVQVGSINSVVRIKKLTADSGKGLTDALLYAALAKFPEGVRPDMIAMTQRSREQLRASRTATNATGAPAPTPQDVEGIPIIATSALSNTEAWTL